MIDKIKVKALGQTVEIAGEVQLVVRDIPPNCVVLFVDMETWKEIEENIEYER